MMHKSYYPPGTGFEILPQYLQKGWNFEFFQLYDLSDKGKALFMFLQHKLQDLLINGIQTSPVWTDEMLFRLNVLLLITVPFLS